VHRLTHSLPRVDKFFAWVAEQFERQGLLPSNPLTKALAYVRERRAGLEVFLGDADVPMDTNHIERALRAIPMGRRNWLFCWTEVGAKHAGIAYFSPSWKAFQADRGRHFRLIVNGISA